MNIFIFAILVFFGSIIIKLHIDIIKDQSSRKAYPPSLYPNFFFSEVFSSCEETNVNKIEELQREIEALQLTLTPENPNNNVRSISKSTRDIEEKYEECLQNYLAVFQDSEERKIIIERLKHKIELGYKTIEKEKEAFISDNGENTISFNFNRQNYFTDILLTGIMIPILLETLNWNAEELNDFMGTIAEKPIMGPLINIFLVIFLYRIMKYTKNKRSMLRGMKQTVLYIKAELMLSAFECALKNIENETFKTT